jgi:NAD(P)-dependent dehydrogenase (short-subunit alcohol dehydrogenase family)
MTDNKANLQFTYADYQPAKDLLKNKNIVVTGAGSGIGRTAAITYAKYGAQVIALSKTKENLEELYDEIEQLRKEDNSIPEILICQFDFLTANEESYEELIEALGKEFKQIDGLLHNVSMLGDLCEIGNYPKGIWDQVMQINVTSVFMLSKACLPLMKNSPAASMIFTSSSVGRTGRAYWGAYSVSKFAVEGLMQCLAEELENTSNIRVNSLNPGGTRSAMRKAAFPAEDPEALPTPEDIMPAYLYLMGNDSKDVNGKAISVRKS